MLEVGIAEQRLVLTGDRAVLAMRNAAHVYLVRAGAKKEQLAEVVESFQVRLDAKKIMTRCTHCGGDFLDRALTFDELPAGCSVPEGVKDAHDSFFVCRRCSKAFWQGGQYASAVTSLTSRCHTLQALGCAQPGSEDAKQDDTGDVREGDAA